MNSLQQLDLGRDNNFDRLRLFACILVIFSHSFLVTGALSTVAYSTIVNRLDLGGLGVNIFFTVSGYLITKSILRQPSLGSYVWARFLRIFPGLLAAAIFCAFIIGPLCTVLPLNVYFTTKATYATIYQLGFLHGFKNVLPGTFHNNPFADSLNSPIWTLPAELLMYLLVLLGGVVLLILKKDLKALLISVPALLVVGVFFIGIPYQSWYMVFVRSWGILFFLGSFCYIFKRYIVINIKIALGILAVYCLLKYFKFPAFFFPRLIVYSFDMMLVYCVLVLSYHPKLQVKTRYKTGDFSYGLYIYAFPIQQLVELKFHLSNPFIHFFITLPLAFLVAVPSWYFVEKPMLKLKTATLFKR